MKLKARWAQITTHQCTAHALACANLPLHMNTQLKANKLISSTEFALVQMRKTQDLPVQPIH